MLIFSWLSLKCKDKWQEVNTFSWMCWLYLRLSALMFSLCCCCPQTPHVWWSENYSCSSPKYGCSRWLWIHRFRKLTRCTEAQTVRHEEDKGFECAPPTENKFCWLNKSTDALLKKCFIGLRGFIRGASVSTGSSEKPQIQESGRPGKGRHAPLSQRPNLQPWGIPGQSSACCNDVHSVISIHTFTFFQQHGIIFIEAKIVFSFQISRSVHFPRHQHIFSG